MRCSLLLPIGLAVLTFSGCSSSNSDPITTALPGSMAFSLGVDPIFITGEQGIYVLVMSEGSSNGDLNADGDLDDLVLHTLDLSTNEVRNHGLALSAPPSGFLLPPIIIPIPTIRDGQIFFYVSEDGQGQTDFNGDGDALDSIAMQLDSRTGSVFNLSQAGLTGFNSFEVIDDQLLFLAAQEQDPTDPSKVPAAELQVYDLQTRAPRNLDLVVSNSILPLFKPSIGNEGLAILGEEQNVDLNSDGDLNDRVLHYYDAVQKQLINSGIATRSSFAHIEGSLFAAAVDEFGEAGSDLNGDGDATDQVLHLIDFENGSRVNLGVDLNGNLHTTPKSLLFLVSESGELRDLNADGDLLDDVVHAYDLETQRMTNTGLATVPFLMAQNGQVGAFSVSESGNPARDLNGDGDTLDDVLFTIDLNTHLTTNQKLSARKVTFSDAYILAPSSASLTESLDSSGTLSSEKFTIVLDTRDDSLHGPFPGTVYETKGRFALLQRRESKAQVDLNGDGDLVDFVFSVLDLERMESRSLGLAGSAMLTDVFSVLIYLSEGEVGEDLNGDGDQLDLVLHIAPLPFPLPQG